MGQENQDRKMAPLCCKSSSLITLDYRGVHWAHGQSVIRHRVGLASDAGRGSVRRFPPSAVPRRPARCLPCLAAIIARKHKSCVGRNRAAWQGGLFYFGR